MGRAILCSFLVNCIGLGQSTEPLPKFEAADVHISDKVANPFVRTGPARGGRYEIRRATMVDLIRIAYGYDPNKVLGGPNWLEMDRFDIAAKVPAESTPETQKLMLQALLEDRFKLKVNKETRPLPTYALTVGKKLQMKEASGTEEPGCHPQSSPGAPAEGSIRIIADVTNGVPTTINLGPGGTIHYACRNMTMAGFAGGLRNMMGAAVGPNQVLDDTGLKGNWNFDVKWSLILNEGDRVSVFDAVEKQLGLKLEERQVPTPVIVVDSVNEKPTENAAGLAEILPPTPRPTEFEVASVKPADPGRTGGRFQVQPGGRVTVEGMLMRTLIARAFNTNNNEQIVGAPKWADSERFDIKATAPSMGPSAPSLDMESVAPLMRALLVDRFKMTYHTEDRPVSAYSLVALKPKMKKADPTSRTSCKTTAAPVGAPPGSQVLTCRNVTMAQFADHLQRMTVELNWPVQDATGIEGGWDLTLTFSRTAALARRGRGPEAGRPDDPAALAAEPSGALTLFEAVEKQLGLRLEMRKRPMPVIVIDHMEQTPTEN
jgi:uncharacterized protein (TIGR03435 family)